VLPRGCSEEAEDYQREKQGRRGPGCDRRPRRGVGTRALALLAAVRLSRTAGSNSTPIDIAPTIAQTRRVDDPSESNSSRSASLGAAVDASKANEASTSDVAGLHGGHESRRREPWRVR
jgi:hypothetical protein